MGFKRSLAPALAAVACAAVVSAQGDCPSAKTVTIQASGSNAQFSGCPTFTGTIVVAPTSSAAAVEIDGLEAIEGDLMLTAGGELVSFTANNLENIGGTFGINDTSALASLVMPRINNVANINWVGVPVLPQLSFSEDGIQYVESCTIVNTYLTSLDGLNFRSLDSFVVTNNVYLNQITMQLGNITEQLTISNNGPQMDLELPNLVWVYNASIGGVTTLNIPSLQSVNGSLSISESALSEFQAQNLTSIGGTLSFYSDPNIQNISMPELKTLNGGLLVVNNTDLTSVSFSNLQTVGGAVDLDGSLTSINLPALKDVRGAFSVKSTKDITDVCNNLQKYSNGVVKGQYSCDPETQTSTTGEDGSTTSSGSSSSSSHSGIASGLYIPSATTGIIGVIAAIFGLL